MLGGVNLGGGIGNIQFFGPAPELTLIDSVVTANRLTASPGVASLGGGLFNQPTLLHRQSVPRHVDPDGDPGQQARPVRRLLSNNRCMGHGAELALVAVAIVAAATACGGSSADKAGGASPGEPLVLTLESEDDLPLSGAPEFADAVARLSGGSMRIRFVQAGRGPEVDFERGIVEDVRGGKAQLGIVGVRVWDTMGVTSFRALLAPLLVDSLPLEMRVLESSLADRMLDGVEQAGVVGIAVLPGPLRLPFGLSRALVGPGDYRDAILGLRPGGVARMTFRALGARTRTYPPGDVSGLDGAELDPTTIVYNGLDQTKGRLTTNVVLWPKPFSIFMNRRAFDALTSDQQSLLRRAGREAAEPELRQIERDAAAALARDCQAAKLSFVEASPAERAGLRAAVQPVYDELGRDPGRRRPLRDRRDARR